MLGAILLFLPALQGAPAAVEITIDLKPGNSFDVLFAGPAAVSGTGDFRGSLAINDSAAEMPLAGRAEAAAGRARLVTTLRYADVPAQWMSRSRPGAPAKLGKLGASAAAGKLGKPFAPGRLGLGTFGVGRL